MSTFNISNMTLAGAYGNAIMTAKDRDRRKADRHMESDEGLNLTKRLATLVRRIVVAVTENRPGASQPSSRSD